MAALSLGPHCWPCPGARPNISPWTPRKHPGLLNYLGAAPRAHKPACPGAGPLSSTVALGELRQTEALGCGFPGLGPSAMKASSLPGCVSLWKPTSSAPPARPAAVTQPPAQGSELLPGAVRGDEPRGAGVGSVPGEGAVAPGRTALLLAGSRGKSPVPHRAPALGPTCSRKPRAGAGSGRRQGWPRESACLRDESEGLWGASTGPRGGAMWPGLISQPDQMVSLGPMSTGEAETLVPATYPPRAPEPALQPINVAVSWLDSEGPEGGTTHCTSFAGKLHAAHEHLQPCSAVRDKLASWLHFRWPHYW